MKKRLCFISIRSITIYGISSAAILMCNPCVNVKEIKLYFHITWSQKAWKDLTVTEISFIMLQ